MTTLPDTAGLDPLLGEGSAFAKGNAALRARDYIRAIACYLSAPIEEDAVGKMVGLNAVLARRGRRREQARSVGTRVAVGAFDLSQPSSSRVLELAQMYEATADVQIVGPIFAKRGKADVWPAITDSLMAVRSFGVDDPASFLRLAQDFVIANPCDLIHVVKPMASNILLGLLYRLIWDTRVVVDVDANDLAALRQPKPISLEGYLKKRETLPPLSQMLGEDWTRLGFGLCDDFDGLTVASDSLRKQFGGAVVSGDAKLRRASALRLRQQMVALIRRPTSVTAEALRLMHTLPEGQRTHAFGVLLDIHTARFDKSPPPSAPRAKPAVAAPQMIQIAALQAEAAPASEVDVHDLAPAAEPAWVRGADLAPQLDAGPLLLLAGQPVGLLPAGERIPADWSAFQAFCDLHALEALDLARLRSVDGDESLAEAAAAEGPATIGSLGTQVAMALADLWFANDCTLRLRFDAREIEGAAAAPGVLRVFQLDLRSGALRSCGECVLYGEGPVFADATLADPLSPLLLATTGLDGIIQGASLLPFPSLCRGGWHHAELAAVGERPEYMANLLATSAALLQDCLASSTPSLGGLRVETRGATGAEKLFRAEVQAWLRMVLGIATEPLTADASEVPAAASSAADEATRYLAVALAEPEGLPEGRWRGRLASRAGAAWTMDVPPDGMPTLTALVARQPLADVTLAASIGPYVLAHPVSGKALSVVTLPPPGADLLALQPRALPFSAPVLRRTTSGDGGSATIEGTAAQPLIISFRELPTQRASVLVSPRASDGEGPLLHRELDDAEKAAARMSVLLSLASPEDAAPLFIESLARQTVAAALDVVVAVESGSGDGRAALEELLSTHFPQRHLIVQSPATTQGQRLNAAARMARSRRLLLVDPGVVLHDARTLETLYLLGLDERVATASCVMLREETFKKGTEVRFHTGGFFPSHVSLLGAPHWVFTEPYTLGAFPAGTYPVIGNSFRLALVNRGAWEALDGADAGAFAHDRVDLDFCLRAGLKGYRHLCTGAVTASDLRAGSTGQYLDSHALRHVPPQRWQEVLAGVALLQEVGG
jgi:hypothetical protein